MKLVRANSILRLMKKHAFVGITVLLSVICSINALSRNLVALNLARALFPQATSIDYVLGHVDLPSRGYLSTFLSSSLAAESVPNLRLQGIARLLTGGDVQLAVTSLNEVVSRFPADKVAYYWLGMAQYLEGNEASALAQWRQAGAGPLLYQIGRVLMEKGQMEEGLLWYYRVLLVTENEFKSPHNRQAAGLVYRELAQVALEQGQTEEAIHYLEQSIAALPQRADIRHRLAALYASQGLYDEAIAQMKIVLQSWPDSVTWVGAMGEIYLQAGEITLAEDFLHQSLRLGSLENAQDRYWYSRNWFSLSIIYYQRQEWEAALEAALQAVTLRGQMDSAWRYQFQRLCDAILTAQPDQMSWYLLAGQIYETGGDAGTALFYYRRALQRWPDAAPLHAAIERAAASDQNP